MGWRDELLSASFRGVPFLVLSASTQMGRRAQIHEFPLKEDPATEDLGRRSRRYSLEAIVLGSNYIAARNQLITALETPGPGTLQHPYLGILEVQIEEVELRETTQEGGSARFQISCTQAAPIVLPAITENTEAALSSALSAAKAQTEAELSAIGTDPRDAVALVRWLGTSSRDQLTAVLSTPASTSLFINAQLSTATPTELERLAGLAEASTSQKTKELQWYVSRSALILRMQQIEVTTANDALQLLQRLLQITDNLLAQEWNSQSVTDDVWQVFSAVQYALQRDIEQRIGKLPQVQQLRVSVPVPALVLAYRLYGDLERESELLERNEIRHPGAVSGLLEVLNG